MEADPRNQEVKELLSRASDLIDGERFEEARELLDKLVERLGSNDADVVGLGTLLDFLEGRRLRAITKGAEPTSLTTHRETPHGRLRQLRPQGYASGHAGERTAWSVLLLHGADAQ